MATFPSSPSTRPTGAKSQTVERATFVLACFSAAEPHLTLADLAARLDLHPSTLYRYVASLQDAGLLERDRRRGGYQLGPRVIELAGIALNQIEVRKHAFDELEALRDESGLLTNLGVLFEGDVLHIDQAWPRGVPRMYTTIGRRAVAHCTAMGKVLLAHRQWPEVCALIERFGWRPYTPQSINDFARLKSVLALVRERGYAIDEQERRPGVRCIAAPIRDYSGEVIAALSVSGANDMLLTEHREPLVLRVREAADRVAYRLGYHATAAYM
jgi:IclR family transcriptional regulator, KDG regulon repressor